MIGSQVIVQSAGTDSSVRNVPNGQSDMTVTPSLVRTLLSLCHSQKLRELSLQTSVRSRPLCHALTLLSRRHSRRWICSLLPMKHQRHGLRRAVGHQLLRPRLQPGLLRLPVAKRRSS
jgi:hypothetical protein